MLEERYQREISAALAARLAYVRRNDDHISIKLNDGGRVIDAGDRLVATTASDSEIIAMIDLAKAKGWESIEPRGAEDFKRRSYELAKRAGMPVRNYTPPEENQPKEITNAIADLADLAPDKPAVPAGTAAPLSDPYLVACRAERQRVRSEIDKHQAELAQAKRHNVEDIRKQAMAEAQASGRWLHITQPVQDLQQKRQVAEAALASEKKRHAKRGWLARTLSSGKLSALESRATAAKAAHLVAVKSARAKLENSEEVRGRMAHLEASSQYWDALISRVADLECLERDLQALENRLLNGAGRELLQSAQAARTLDAAEQCIFELLRSQAQQKAEEHRRREELEQRQERARDRIARHLETKPKGPIPTPR